MNKLIKPASIAFYFLWSILCFALGIYVAKLLDVAEGQMLAGGAIVLGWGVIFALIGFVFSLLIARAMSTKLLVRLNFLLLGVIVIVYAVVHYQYLQRQRDKDNNDIDTPSQVTEPVDVSVRSSTDERLTLVDC